MTTFLRAWKTTGPNADALRKKLAFPAALCIVIAFMDLLFISLFLIPSVDRRDAARAQIAEMRHMSADAALFLKQKEIFSGMVSEIPTQQDVPLLFRDIVRSARSANLQVGSVNSDIPTPGNVGLAQLTFSVPLIGSYPDIKRFIYSMETTDRLLGIQGLALKAEKSRVAMTMKLVTYIKGD